MTSKFFGWRAAVLTLVAGVSIGVALGVVLAIEISHKEGNAISELTSTYDIEIEPYRAAVEVTLTPALGNETTILSGTTGTVTRFDCRSGGRLEDGESQLSIDGRPLRNAYLAEPLWRDLAVGDRGADVRAVKDMLATQGLPISEGDRLDSATIGSWRLYTSLSDVRTISPSDFVWLPLPSVAVEECQAQVGQRIDVGTALASTTREIVGFSIAGAPPVDPAREIVLSTARFPLVAEFIDDPEQVAMLLDVPEVVASMAEEGQLVRAEAVLAAPVESARVPPSALTLDGDSACVWSEGSAYTVEILDSMLGKSIIRFDRTPPSAVELSPKEEGCG